MYSIDWGSVCRSRAWFPVIPLVLFLYRRIYTEQLEKKNHEASDLCWIYDTIGFGISIFPLLLNFLPRRTVATVHLHYERIYAMRPSPPRYAFPYLFVALH
jgi:hypothetical protein